MMTKNLDVTQVEMYIKMIGLEYKSGRASAAAQLHAVCEKKSEVEHVYERKSEVEHSNVRDNWDCRGQGGLWRRKHAQWRTELFTPTRVSRGPSRGTQLACCRRTDGVFKDGSTFTIVDDWTGKNRYDKLKKEWRGTTSFIGCPNGQSSEFGECINLLATAPADNLGER